MKNRHRLSLMLIILMSIPFTGWAQALFDPTKIISEPSRLFPIVPEAEIIGTPNGAIGDDVIAKIYDRCMSRLPSRFTPEAHEYYCACSSAATQGTMTITDLKTLQKDTNRKVGNKAFEKYVHNVMKPCLEMPVEESEYMYCVMYRKNDWRIRYPLPYCKCVSRGVREHFEIYGEPEMMMSWGNTLKKYNDPVDSLWDNEAFQKGRTASKKGCIGSYMDPKFLKD